MSEPLENRRIKNLKTSSYKGIRTTLIGIITNIILACVKALAGILGHSYALLADATESASDVFTSIIVLAGIRIAQKPADENHPYGHGKAEPIVGTIVASALFLAAIFIIFKSTHELTTPRPAPEPFTLIILVMVIITKEMLFRFVINVGKSVDSVAIKNDAWHHRSDAITSGAAFIGISIALIGGQGYENADSYAALFASVIIIINAYHLFKPALLEMMDAAPPAKIIEHVISVANQVDGVIAIDKCFARKMGFEYYIDIHVIVDGNISVYKGHEISHVVKDHLMKKNPQISNVLVHIEPATEERLARRRIIDQNNSN